MVGLCWSRRHRPHVHELGALVILAFLWCSLSLLYHLFDEPGLRHILLDLRYVPIVLIPVAWLVFSWTASGLSELSLQARAALTALPLMTLFLLATNQMHGLMFTGMYEHTGRWGVMVGHKMGPWFWVHTAYSYCLMMTGLALSVVLLARSHRTLRPRVGLLLVGALAPALINATFVVNRAIFDYVDPSPIGFAISTLCYGVCVFHFRVLELTPVSAGRLLESGDCARIVLSDDGRVINLNKVATKLLDRALVGEVAQGVLADMFALREGRFVRQEVRVGGLSEASGRSEAAAANWFEAEVSRIDLPSPYQHDTHAWLITLTGISERKREQARTEAQLLAAMDRAGRQAAALADIKHSLQPRLQGIQGLAESLQADLEGEARGFSQAITEAAASMQSRLNRNLEAAGLTDGCEPRKRPSRAPVRRSTVDPRESGRRAEDQTR